MNNDMQMDHDLSGDFDDSIMVDPISIKSQAQPTLFAHPNHGQNTDFGPYNDIKLNKYLDFINDYPQKAVQLITIDPNSYFLDMSTEGIQLLQMYSSHDVVFCGVMGDRQVGKSLFSGQDVQPRRHSRQPCIWQLTQFSSINKPGIHVYSMPFSKGNLKIFFVEMITSQAMGTKQYEILTKVLMILCSSIILINDVYAKQSVIQDFEKIVKNSLVDVLFKGSNLTNKSNCNVLPNLLVNIERRQKQQSSPQNFRSQFFDSIKFQLLTDAMNKKFKGHKRELSQVSFLAKDCIDSEYIRKSLMFLIRFLFSLVKKIQWIGLQWQHMPESTKCDCICYQQSQKNLMLKNVFTNVFRFNDLTRELYNSAFNLCVMIYQEHLQKQFQDEQPKSLDRIIQIFQQSSLSVLSKYNQFNLQPQLHQQFERKLIVHIQQKQNLIMDINNKKGASSIQRLFKDANLDDPSLINSNLIAISKKTVQSQGRDQALSNKMSQILKRLGSTSNNVDYRIMKQIEKLVNDKNLRLREIEVLKKSNKQFYQQQRAKNDQMQKLNKINRQLQKKINLNTVQLQRMKNKQLPDLNKYEVDLKSITQQSVKNFKIITQLEEELNKQQFLANAKSQRQKVILEIVQKQKNIQAQLRGIQVNQNGIAQNMKENKEEKIKQPKKNSKMQDKRNQKQGSNVKGSQVKSSIKPK